MTRSIGFAWLGLCVLVASSSTAQDDATPPTTQPTAPDEYTAPPSSEVEGWLVYDGAPTYGVSDVADLAPGQATPEAAIVHYMASRLRLDQRYLEVLIPEAEWNNRLRRKLAEHDEWTFTAFRLVRRQVAPTDGDAEIGFTVYFEIQVGANQDSGTDEFGLRRRNGVWQITSVPT